MVGQGVYFIYCYIEVVVRKKLVVEFVFVGIMCMQGIVLFDNMVFLNLILLQMFVFF